MANKLTDKIGVLFTNQSGEDRYAHLNLQYIELDIMDVPAIAITTNERQAFLARIPIPNTEPVQYTYAFQEIDDFWNELGNPIVYSSVEEAVADRFGAESPGVPI